MDSTVTAALIGVGGVALAGAFTVLGTWMGATFARRQAKEMAEETAERDERRMRDQRLWEARKAAYTAILIPCRKWGLLREEINDGFHGPDSNAYEYDPSEEHKKTRDAAQAEYRKMREAFDEHRILLSDEFSARVTAVQKALNDISENDIPPETAWQINQIAGSAHRELLTIAKRELAS